MIEQTVRRFLAKRSVAGSQDDSLNGDGTIIRAGKIYIEIRPGSGIIRPEDAPVATYGLDLEMVKDHGGINKYFDEMEELQFKDTPYFEEYQKYWENTVQRKYREIRESLKELNSFSHMVGKPQYGLRQVNPGSPLYNEPATHDFVVEGEEDESQTGE